ncbi:hypothetical protein [Phenylobacterium sp.]|uniref:hypothetical protein n=1 Tax=Phenylobacterium sp. TaxID=1871053 RepID=UPI00272FD436|nr:hypothetical protein [Phenylobacterium sp.]MDP1619193.1 hypothetical protein [Phenylobacterium sp.]MDP1989008.1 hypothetical protein [Phenylobacterium sp.]
MEFDFDTLFRAALVVVGLLAFIVARRRKSPASAVYTIQVGDLTHEVAYVVRGGQIHVTSDGRRASAPPRAGLSIPIEGIVPSHPGAA